MATRTLGATEAGKGPPGTTEAGKPEATETGKGTPEATEAGKGSPEATEAGTPEATEAVTSSEEEEYLPPCRTAALYVVPCPLCGREMRLKTLRYAHKCGRIFDAGGRAREHAAVLARMGKAAKAQCAEQPLEHHMDTTPCKEEELRRKYNNMLNF